MYLCSGFFAALLARVRLLCAIVLSRFQFTNWGDTDNHTGNYTVGMLTAVAEVFHDGIPNTILIDAMELTLRAFAESSALHWIALLKQCQEVRVTL